jgi:SAM-dependent methyltransferase
MTRDLRRPERVGATRLFRAFCHVARGLDWCGIMVGRASRVMTHLAAGTLTFAELRFGIARAWDGLASGDADVSVDLMSWEDAWYRRWLKPDDRILVVGCGPGRDLVALLERGYRVDGLDIAPRCVEIARRLVGERGLVSDVRVGSLEDVELPRCYDVVIFSFYCYSYIPQSDTRVAVLRRARASLASGGRVLISYIPARRRPSRLLALTRLAGRLTRSDWRVENGDCVGYAFGRPPALHFEHHFQRDEIEREARAAGLTIAGHRVVEEGMLVLGGERGPGGGEG